MSRDIRSPSLLRSSFLSSPFNALLLKRRGLGTGTRVESVRIRKSTQITHSVLLPASLPLAGFGALRGRASHTLCLPQLRALVHQAIHSVSHHQRLTKRGVVVGTLTYFLRILKAQPGPTILVILGKYLLSESVNVAKQDELAVLRADTHSCGVKATGLRVWAS